MLQTAAGLTLHVCERGYNKNKAWIKIKIKIKIKS